METTDGIFKQVGSQIKQTTQVGNLCGFSFRPAQHCGCGARAGHFG